MISSFIGAAGTVLTAYVTVRLRRVEHSVNGHTAKLERELVSLRDQLELWRIAAASPRSDESR